MGGSNGAICGSIKSKMAADGHLGMTALSRVTLASTGAGFLVYTLLALALTCIVREEVAKNLSNLGLLFLFSNCSLGNSKRNISSHSRITFI